MPSDVNLDPSLERAAVLRGLKRDIAFVVVCKVIIILLAAFFVFGAAQRVFVDPAVMTHHLMR